MSDELLFAEEEVNAPSQTETDRWNILVVDDDAGVHSFTKLALNDFILSRKTLAITSAYSAKEAIEILKKQSFAVILLDIVMETDHAGFDVVEFLRKELKDPLTRIIIRTGQPGKAPERFVIDNYDINDYKEKTELTTDRLYTTMRTALTQYRQIVDLQNSKNKIEDQQQQLQEYSQTLEKTVDARTSELRLANERLKELDTMKSMFIASMSHELRTPLNAIIGFTTLILTGMVGKIEEKQKDYLGRINGAAKHLLSMIVDVIDISKIEAGHIEAVPEQFELNALVDEVARMVEESIKKKNLSLQIELDHAIELCSDRRRVEQSILNYLSNAVKYTENGLITVGAYEEKEYVVITVSDTGIGFDDDEKSRLFKPFERLDSQLKVQAGGSGIGLYMTKKIVEELLGGEVFVSSKLGEGSTFGLKIPKGK
ncbi:MAG: ATP-binding protein [Campylobacterales bacterium]|nr:ATP-binding protein [Campylobacterales bacterium]